MKMRNLGRWNRIQARFIARLNLSRDPQALLAFASWFAYCVDHRGRLPRLADAAQWKT
ncbi:MAG TPA: hypothetical protein P5567_11675 [Kiritimatiellia bacterium]|nr:hypothetical protein [Kiritimatiellia bacterium]HRZ13099.1 hypothetical protein [Kiritimatiellia bacterium]HSA17520.1 hypothetical protein [Kiritimatiellia bacterium]